MSSDSRILLNGHRLKPCPFEAILDPPNEDIPFVLECHDLGIRTPGQGDRDELVESRAGWILTTSVTLSRPRIGLGTAPQTAMHIGTLSLVTSTYLRGSSSLPERCKLTQHVHEPSTPTCGPVRARTCRAAGSSAAGSFAGGAVGLQLAAYAGTPADALADGDGAHSVASIW